MFELATTTSPVSAATATTVPMILSPSYAACSASFLRYSSTSISPLRGCLPTAAEMAWDVFAPRGVSARRRWWVRGRPPLDAAVSVTTSVTGSRPWSRQMRSSIERRAAKESAARRR
jgi:hypothetical protein